MTSRLQLPLALLVPLLAGCGSEKPARPNVVLVTLDTTRADYLSTYGFRPGHTPAFDALATEGTRFDQAMSASAVTPVSHATILTGEFPYTHGLRVLVADGGFRLPREHATLAEAFRAAGYATLAVHSAFPVSRQFGFDRAFDVFRDLNGEMQEKAGVRGWDTSNLQRRSDETTDICLGALEGVEQPFLLWVHYWDPHDPELVPPAEFLPDYPRDADGKLLAWGDDGYAAEVHFMDQQFGRLVEGLKERGLYEDTIFIVTSDHGEGLTDGQADHGWAAHRMVYEEQIQVPLIVRIPGVEPTSGVDALVRTADIAPTLYDYAGIGPPRPLDGISLRPLLEGSEEEPRLGYAEQINGFDHNARMVERRPDSAFLYCLRDGDWKLTYRPHMPAKSELFNLREDRDERRNLFDSSSETTQRLLAELARIRPWVLAPFAPDGSDASGMSENLGQLGYAGGGEVASVAWKWICPRHPGLVTEEPARCATCKGLPIPIQVD